MQHDYWLKQTAANPLFPELEWSRPENRAFAGKLLIVGGNVHGFSAPAEAYAESQRAGIGVAHALLPSAIQKIVGIIIEHADFAPSTPSGSFSQKALVDVLEHARWSDGVLLAGDLGRNSETAILLEKFFTKYSGKIVITNDAVDYVTSTAQTILHRKDTLLVTSFGQLQRLGIAAKMEQAITSDMDLLRLIEWLHEFTTRFAPGIIVKHLDTVIVAMQGRISSTKTTDDSLVVSLKTAATAAVWWIQTPQKPFEALTTAVHQAL